MDIALRVAGGVRGLVEIRVIGLRSCRLQYNRIDQTCGHNQDSIEICSAQQAGAGGGLLYTGSWHFGARSLSSELARAAILNPLLRAGHISQCADHNITVCHVGAACFGFRAAS